MPAPLNVPVETANCLGVKLRVIPAGEFLMGSSDEEMEKLLTEADEQGLGSWYRDRIQDEWPQRHVKLTKPFAMSIYEKTRGQFRQFVDATKGRGFAGLRKKTSRASKAGPTNRAEDGGWYHPGFCTSVIPWSQTTRPGMSFDKVGEKGAENPTFSIETEIRLGTALSCVIAKRT